MGGKNSVPQPKEGEVLVRIDDEDMKVGSKEGAHLFTRRDMVRRVPVASHSMSHLMMMPIRF